MTVLVPDPLLTYELYTCFIAIWKIKDEEIRTEKLKAIIKMLPMTNDRLVQYVYSAADSTSSA